MSDCILKVRDLKTWFGGDDQPAKAVDGISFDLHKGKTFALLGESGCGKSMTSLSIMRLVPEPAGRIKSGQVLLGDSDLLKLPEIEMRNVRGRRIAMIFQEPMTSLNPVLTVGHQIAETVRRCDPNSASVYKRCIELLEQVGIPDPTRRYKEHPHQLSGGMKQRVMIAMALAGKPEILIADEPTTALDVTIQAQILKLISDLQKEYGMSVLLITHDLAVVSQVADEVGVMYAGQLVEQADADEFFRQPKHPYAQKLFDSLPNKAKRGQHLAVIKGFVPSLTQEFSGCRFQPRCESALAHCSNTIPHWQQLEQGRGVRCFLYQQPGAAGAETPLASNQAPQAQVTSAPEQTPDQVPQDAAVAVADSASAVAAKQTEPLAAADNAAAISETPSQNSADDKAGDSQQALLKVDGLQVHFPVHKGLFRRVVGQVRAVDNVSLTIPAGTTLALVGESGCGKTTVGKGILQLLTPTGGSVKLSNDELTKLSHSALRRKRSDIQIIFQDPYSSMNPRMMIGKIIEEGMVAQKMGGNAAQRQQRIDELLLQVGLQPDIKYRYPHEFSGGQRQRICIARALALEPKLIICDEPTSALDVSVQAQILNLLKDLQQRLGLAYLFITHDLSVVEYLAHEIAVMYLGRIVEYGQVDDILSNSRHPYTKALLAAIPEVDRNQRKELSKLRGEMPSPINPPVGCHFNPRCPDARQICRNQYPPKVDISPSHSTRCFLYNDSIPK